MSTDYMNKIKLQVQGEMKSVKHLKKELAAIEATIQEYEEKIEKAEEEGEETDGLREMLEHWKEEREKLKRQLEHQKKSDTEDESDSDDDDEEDDEKEDQEDTKAGEGEGKPRRNKVFTPSFRQPLHSHKPFYRKKHRRGGGRVTPDYLMRLQHTKFPFVKKSLKTKIPESSAAKYPGLGLGPRSILNNRIQFGQMEEVEDESREAKESFPTGEPWNELEEALTEAQNNDEVTLEEGCFRTTDVQGRLSTPIDGIDPRDALIEKWDQWRYERFTQEEMSRWSMDDHWGCFNSWVNRLAYSEIETIVRDWAAGQTKELRIREDSPDLAFGNTEIGLEQTEVSPGHLKSYANPLRPPEDRLNPYYRNLENPLQRDNPLESNQLEDQR